MKLFSAGKIGNVELPNRLVRSATWEGMATDKGEATDKLAGYMGQLATGGVGLIISGHLHIERGGQASLFQTGIFDDSLIPGLKKMVDAAHQRGTKIFAQITHAGCHAVPELTGMMSFGVSAITTTRGGMALAMSSTAVKHKIVAFAAAAKRAVEAGFDGIQLHGGHGYLISQFLSPFYNKRTDEWGGSVENRVRFLLETITAVRIAVGNVPLIIKMNATDCIDGGISTEDVIQIAKILEGAGLDGLEFSGGLAHPDAKFSSSRPINPKTTDEEGYYAHEAKLYKEQVKKMPLILVGGYRSFEKCEQVIANGEAAFISMCRPLICEPDLPRRWQNGSTRRALCTSCNGCRQPGLSGDGIKCVI